MVQIPQCPAKDSGMSRVGDGETPKVLKQESPCAGRHGGGETRGAPSLLLESVAWFCALFRTFILDLKAFLPSLTNGHNST